MHNIDSFFRKIMMMSSKFKKKNVSLLKKHHFNIIYVVQSERRKRAFIIIKYLNIFDAYTFTTMAENEIFLFWKIYSEKVLKVFLFSLILFLRSRYLHTFS